MPEKFSVSISKDSFLFCSGHFITYDGNHCEPLHGHNYKVQVEVESSLDSNHYVFDFIALTEMTKQICQAMDHRMLLPTKSKLIRVETKGQQVEVRYEEKFWSFPVSDCVLLPIENTTTELLARHIGMELQRRLKTEKNYQPVNMRVMVEESPGHSATWSV